MLRNPFAVGLLCFLSAGWPAPQPASAQTSVQDPPRYSQPSVFSYDELLVLGGDSPLTPELSAKLDQLLATPFLSNEAYYDGSLPHRPGLPGLGPGLRTVVWNIERGFRLDSIKSAFGDPEGFFAHAAALDPDLDAHEFHADLAALRGADLIILNEADWGLRRSGYRAVARELADALQMNWAYGVEFVEVDPIALGVEEFESVEDEQDRRLLVEQAAVDPYRVQALHGTAVLSRYPILSARLRPFELQPYDWFESEKNNISPVEAGKREAAEIVLAETISREIRRGGRMYLMVDLAVPDIEEGVVTVVATHLEIRAEPKQRRAQLEEILADVKHIENPLILAGDMNTSGGNSEPTSLKRELFRRFGSASYWANTGIKYSTGAGLLYDLARGGFNFFKNNQDPTAEHIPLLAPNPEEGFFETLERFRFSDGTVFDFRGSAVRTARGYGGTLGNSNQRDDKGFAVTFEVSRTFGPLGKAKLDWIFVKPYIEDPEDDGQPYVFAPHFGRTLTALNEAHGEPLSDHRPITVDLPFRDVAEEELSRARRPVGNDSPLETVGDGAGAAVKAAGSGLEQAGSAIKGVFTGGDEKDGGEETGSSPEQLQARPAKR